MTDKPVKETKQPKLTRQEEIQKIDEVLQQLSKEPGYKPLKLERSSGMIIDYNGNLNYGPNYCNAKLKIVSKEANQEKLQEKYINMLGCKFTFEFEKIDKINVGDKYVEFPVSTFTSDGIFNIVHKPGEILILNLWDISHQELIYFEQMLNQHPEWKGKVRIVCINLDEKKDAAVERIGCYKSPLVEHYYSPGMCKGAGPQLYEVNAAPFAILVGVDGIIMELGHPVYEYFDCITDALYKGQKRSEYKKPPKLKKYRRCRL
jgi:hypothetical protein